MKKTLTQQEVSQMLPAYVLGTLESDKMLACQSYLRNKADQNLLLQYRNAEDMATQLTWTLPLQRKSVPTWVKQQLMTKVLADCASKRSYNQWPIRHRVWRIKQS